MSARRTLPCAPASAGAARRFVTSALSDLGHDDLGSTATLLVSELVANAVLHTTTPVEVVVSASGERVRVEVHDGSPQLPVAKNYSNMSSTGRGLVLVARMASDWGAARTDLGKVVWFELDERDAPAIDLLDAEAL